MKIGRFAAILLPVSLAFLFHSDKLLAKTNPTITWSRPSAISYGTALSSTQLDATASVAGTFDYSPVAGTVPYAGTQTLSVTFTPTDTTDYNTVSKNVNITVNMVTPTITWSVPSPITYGTALGATQLDATTTVAGTFTYSPAAGTVLAAGTQQLSVNFVPNDTVDFNSPNKHINLTVSQATPTVSWSTPAIIIYGTALSATQLNATATVPGTFQYNPDFGTVLTPGSHTLSVTFNPTDYVDYSSPNSSVSLSVSGVPPADIITTVAGDLDNGYTGNGGQAFAARLNHPTDVAVDAPGNLYIVDEQNNVIREVAAATGIINNFAGNHATGYSGNGGPATSAKLNLPMGVALDSAANVYIADYGNNVIRLVTASTGIITTFAGNHANGYSGDGGPATSAVLCAPEAVVVDSAGNLYIADTGNNVVRKVTAATGIITTVAGNGIAGYLGDGGLATNAELNSVAGVAVDGSGDLYIADTNNNVVREVAAATGIITTIIGNGTAGYLGDGGQATAAELNAPMGMAFDSSGNLYIADSNNNVVREVMFSTGWIVTVAGNGTAGFSGDGGEATLAELNAPMGVAIDSAGDLYIAHNANSVVREVGTVINVTINPLSTTLSSGQQSSFTATVSGSMNSAVIWSISPSNAGMINSSGVYTAPAGISGQQTVSVTAASQVDSSKTATAIITLMPNSGRTTPTITWSKPSPIVYGTPLSGTQLDATANVGGTFVYSPASGTVLSAGNQTLSVTFTPTDTVDYTTTTASATLPVTPATLTVTASNMSIISDTVIPQLTDTITGFVNGDSANVLGGTPALSTTATGSSPVGTYPITVTIGTLAAANYQFAFVNGSLTISSPACTSNGHSYARAITIDHTKVHNSDLTNFPFLFSTIDSQLATVANGGLVANPNGYDIVFTSDVDGQNPLDYEMEEYNPATGQVVAWVRIPALSHMTDTTIYMFYGNSNITTLQQNPAGVWDSDYGGVWHLNDSSTTPSLNDSTANGNTASVYGNTSVAEGEIANATALSGSPNYIDAGHSPSVRPTHTGTMSIWVNYNAFADWTTPMANENADSDVNGASFWSRGAGQINFEIANSSAYDRAVAAGPQSGQWYYLTGTWDGSTVSFYMNGALVSSTQQTVDAAPGYDLTFGVDGCLSCNGDYLNGSIEEARISGVARSADWVATEYANQSSPSTFYSASTESFSITPAAVTLYGQQSQNFTASDIESCNPSIQWTASPSGLGTLTQAGVYTAPANISFPQTVTITATNTSGPGTASATVLLIPSPLQPALTLAAEIQPPYVVGASETFVGTFKNLDGTPIPNVPVTFTVTGANSSSGTAVTDVNGTARFAYTGGSSGTDTIQAAGSAGGGQTASNRISAVWIVPAQPISTTTVTGLFFTDNGPSGFDRTPADQPAFTQSFPTLIFNPEHETVTGNNSGVDNNTLPFTNIVTDAQGNFAGTIVAQGNGYQAGCDTLAQDPSEPSSCTTLLGNMINFQAMFSGSFVVKSPGDVTFTYYDDDLFILGIGNGATLVSGPTTNFAPSATPFLRFPTMGSNALSINSAQPIVVNFPAPGTYPYEIDYAQADYGPLGLYITAGASTTGVAPTASITLCPGSVSPQPLGGNLSFTATAIDATGNPVPNLNVNLTVTFADNFNKIQTTNASGVATFNYQNQSAGTAVVQATALIDGMIAYSNTVNVPWTLPPTDGGGNQTNGSLTVAVSGYEDVVLPNSLQLTGTATDTSLPAGDTIEYQWSKLSGPGSVSFTSSAQLASPTASFAQPGIYQLQLTATEINTTTLVVGTSASAQLTVNVSPQSETAQGWIGSPQNGAQVSGVVPIMITSGETLTSCALSVYPASNPNAVTSLNCNTTGGTSQIATWDTTQISNDTYWIALQATDSNGNSSYNLALVTVVGNYKPGRVTSTVTDLVVPSTGVAISIQRTYDSLNASTVGDFGYGWNLGINVNLSVDSKGNVTFTLGGQRRTFYLTPQILGCSPLVGCIFPWFYPSFTPEPGLHGTLTDSAPGCPFDILLQDGECEGGGYYNPPGYIYTDANGTAYNISASGGLQSIMDRSGNGLTITSGGITSTTGLNVPFVRDSQNRITQITDPLGNIYSYGYDDNGNLVSVTYPQTTNTVCGGASAPNTSQYTYSPAHYYTGGTDANCHLLPTTAYYGSGDTDSAGNSLANKLKSVSDALGETTSYAYDLSTTSTVNGVEIPNTGITTVTYPADANGNIGTATMIYDSLGDLLQSTDPLGHTTTNTYDVNQNLLSTTDPLGHTMSYTYDSNGNKTSQTYPATGASTNTTSYTNYNQYSEPTSTTDEDGNVRTFNYDLSFNPQIVTDSLGTLMSTSFNPDGTMQTGAIGYDITVAPTRASQFTYDGYGNLASKSDALNRTTSYTYNSLGQKITMVEPILAGSSAAASTTTYQYDPFGNLTQTSAPLGRVTTSQYDSNGNKISDTDARGHTTTYQYDALNRLVLTTYPDSTTSSKTYDFRNNVVTETDQDGHVTKHQYDLAGREISVTMAYGTSNAMTTTYAYDNAGRKTSETDALGNVSNYAYDAAGNLVSVTMAYGTANASTTSYTYDNARNRISITDGNNNKTQYAYDARKRLTVTTYPDSTTKTNAYDGPGNLVSVTDEAGNQVQYTYDAADQLVSVIQVNSPNTSANTTVYGYDANGNPIALEDANTHTTSQYFDVLNELSTKTLPDGTLTESRTYDNNGNLASVTHFNGVVTTYTYDTLNRLLSRSTPGEATVSFTYTQTGKYATSADASGTTTYTYDSMDRLSSKATPEGTLSYTYDAAGHVQSIGSSHVNGASMSYTYDSMNRLATVTDNRLVGNNVTSYAYDNASNVTTVTYPNGVQAALQYDTLNRVTGLATQQTGYTYQRGATGNLTNATELNGRTVNWTYDGIYRLTGETISLAPSHNNGSASYGLDPVGNRTSETASLPDIPSGTFSFNANDELSSESNDQNGNVIASGGKTFSYDSQNELVSMTNGTTSASIIYDGDGNRVSKTLGGVTTKYLVDDLNPTGYPEVVEELNGSGAVTRTYTYGLQRISEYQPISGTWTASFYGCDGGGNVRTLTNSAGTITDSYEYDAFGNEFTVSGTTPNEMMYRGEQFDFDLGLYYLRARYYNPLTGRFMSRDPNDPQLIVPVRYNPVESNRKPLDPKKLHKYLYGSGDPVNRVDPTGREDEEEYGFLYTEIRTGLTAYEYGYALGVAARYACYGDAVYALLNWVINDKAEGPIDLICTAIAAGTP